MSDDEKRKQVEMEIIDDDSFSFDGFQVVRGEFFAHTYEPSLTFADCKVYVNTACIRKLPDYDYVQMLVNPEQKKLAVRPCHEDEKDSFRWCSATSRRSPKQITCKIFFAKVFTLMGWDPKDRYKLLGKLIRSKNELLFVYDLSSPEVYARSVSEDGKVKTSRTPNYPSNWQNQFGLPVTEHQGSLIVNIFKESAVFGLEKDPKGTDKAEVLSSIKQESEVEQYEQLSITGTMEQTNNDDRPEKTSSSPVQTHPSPTGGS